MNKDIYKMVNAIIADDMEKAKKLFKKVAIEKTEKTYDDPNNIEAKYKKKLKKVKKKMAKQLHEALMHLVHHIDVFLDEHLKFEVNELRNDIDQISKKQQEK